MALQRVKDREVEQDPEIFYGYNFYTIPRDLNYLDKYFGEKSKFYQEIPCGFDGWSLKSTNGKCDAVKLDLENEKLCMYHMDIIIFNQTSLPCAPFSSCNLMK